jgi:hypothetical protein
MLNSLFKPAWQSNSASKRLGAIPALNSENPEHHEVLLQLARDSDPEVSAAAIQKISSLTSLLELSKTASEDSLCLKIDERIDQLTGADNTLDEKDFLSLIAQNPQLSVRVAIHATIASVRMEAMKKMSTDQLLKVLESSMYTDVRQYVAQNLGELEQLESARKMLQGKDKSAERIIKNRIDEIHTVARIKAQNLATVEKLIEEAEYLASHDWLPEFQAKFQAHRQLRDSLDFDIEPSSRQRYQSFRDTIEKRFEEQRLIEETQKARQKLLSDMEGLVKKLATDDLATSINTYEELQPALNQFSTRWQELSTKDNPEKELVDRYEHLLAAIQSVVKLGGQAVNIFSAPTTEAAESPIDTSLSSRIQKISSALKNLKWPQTYGQLNLALEMQQQLDEWQKLKQSQENEKEEKLARLHKKISSVSRLSRAGNLGRAKQTFERAEKALAQYSGKEHTRLKERLEDARKTMGDMGDWKNFATEPKYIELCEAMESLTGSSFHADKLSENIKELQKQWKSLGHSDISDEYWARFKESADRAYKPCADFFEQRRNTRKQNLQQRQQIVEKMRELLEKTDWEDNPDYRLIQSEVRKTGDEFFAIKDVEHGPGQKQWKKFSQLKDEVYAKLDTEYNANIELKQELVKEATRLAEAEARAENLASLKTLQIRWKNVGITKRNADQKVWKEFKKQGDIVFNNVQAIRKEQRNEVDQQLDAYRSIIRQINSLAKSARELSQSSQEFTQLQSQYAELPELPENLPEKLTKGIQQDYGKACEQYDMAHQRIMNKKHNEQIDALRQKAELCAQLESLGESASDDEVEKIALQWNDIELKDTQLEKRIETRRKAAQKPANREDIGTQRRMLCIQLEIATGQETPQEDKATRMQYQLDLMNESGLGQPASRSKDELEQMEIEWLCMPGAEPALQKSLDKRFFKVLKSR